MNLEFSNKRQFFLHLNLYSYIIIEALSCILFVFDMMKDVGLKFDFQDCFISVNAIWQHTNHCTVLILFQNKAV